MKAVSTFTVSYGSISVTPPPADYGPVMSFAMAHPLDDAALVRARRTLEEGLHREAEIAQAPITSGAEYTEARRVAATVRARI